MAVRVSRHAIHVLPVMQFKPRRATSALLHVSGDCPVQEVSPASLLTSPLLPLLLVHHLSVRLALCHPSYIAQKPWPSTMPATRRSSTASSRRPSVASRPVHQSSGPATFNRPVQQQANPATSTAGNTDRMVNKPFVCCLKWTPSQEQIQTNFIPLAQGDEGYIVKVTSNGWWLQVVLPRKQKTGLVPCSAKYLVIGTSNYGQLTVDAGMTASLFPQIDPGSLSGRGLFARTVSALCLAFKARENDMNLSTALRARLNDPGRLTAVAANGASAAGALHALDRPDCNLSSLTSGLTAVGPAHRGASGVYIQVLSFETPRMLEIRIGKAVDFAVRANGHRSTRASKKGGQFYAAWDEAVGYVMLPLVRDIENAHDRTLIEQFMVLMTGSYRPWLLTRRRAIKLQSPISDLANQSEHGTGLADAMDANFLTKLAEPVFTSTNWVPCTQRPSFGCQKGWNCTSPIYKSTEHEPLAWTRTDVPGVKAVFRRSGSIGTQTRLFGMLSRGATATNRSFSFLIHRSKGMVSAGLPEGDRSIYVVFEVMLNGEPHTTLYARLIPVTLAPWSDWNLALGVAIKLEWVDEGTGQWKSMYCQKAKGDMALRDSTEPGSCESYSKAMALRRYLLRQTCPNFPEQWQFDLGGVADVQQVVYDHLKQTVQLYPLRATTRAAVPRRITSDEKRVSLAKLGATRIYSPLSVEEECDWCRLVRRPERVTVTGMGSGCLKPRLGPNCKLEDRSCIWCVRLGIPCSFTQNPSAALRQAIAVPTVADKSVIVFDIQDPQIQQGSSV